MARSSLDGGGCRRERQAGPEWAVSAGLERIPPFSAVMQQEDYHVEPAWLSRAPSRGAAMAICVIFEAPGMTQAQYDQVPNEVAGDRPPEGSLSHVAGPTENGWYVVETWESQE